MTLFKSIFAKTLIASCIGLAVFSSSIQAQEFGFNHRGKHIKQMLRGLDLTAEQRQDIKQIVREARQEAKLYKEDIKLAKQETRDLVQQPDFDQQGAEGVITTNAVVKMQLAQKRAETRHEIWTLLTEEQQQKWQDRIDNRAEKEPREFNSERQAKFFERLDFTDAQIEQATQIREQARASTQELKSKRKAFKQAEFDIITADEFSVEAWQALHAQYADDFAQGQLIALETRNQMFNLMTEEQRQKAEKIRKRKGRKGKRRAERA
jgi:Spy/CpxP family protein refolding chaperone